MTHKPTRLTNLQESQTHITRKTNNPQTHLRNLQHTLNPNHPQIHANYFKHSSVITNGGGEGRRCARISLLQISSSALNFRSQISTWILQHKGWGGPHLYPTQDMGAIHSCFRRQFDVAIIFCHNYPSRAPLGISHFGMFILIQELATL